MHSHNIALIPLPTDPSRPTGRHLDRRWAGWIVCLMLANLLAALPAAADTSKTHWRDQPGYFPLEKLGILARKDLSVEINLQGPMLRMVARAVRAAEPDFASLIGNLAAIRVQVAPADDLDLEAIGKRIQVATEWLEANGWLAIVRTRDDDDETYVYSHEVDDEIDGLAILVMDSSEVAVINIIGGIDLEQIEHLGETFDIPQLSKSRKDSKGEESEP